MQLECAADNSREDNIKNNLLHNNKRDKDKKRFPWIHKKSNSNRRNQCKKTSNNRDNRENSGNKRNRCGKSYAENTHNNPCGNAGNNTKNNLHSDKRTKGVIDNFLYIFCLLTIFFRNKK